MINAAGGSGGGAPPLPPSSDISERGANQQVSDRRLFMQLQAFGGCAEPFAALTRKPELAMLGRTYASGFEPDLEDWLIMRPRRTVLNPAWPWAVWYPLRRTGAFARLSAQEQGAILREHGAIGRAYGEADLAHDVRLACHGLDVNDNDFLIGLVGKELQPLSHIVQAMRKTAQTSQYMASLGPFFVGHVIWQSPSR